MGFTATPDGIFGPKMETSIACWQEMFDLTVDGIAGPQTWHSLLFDR
jgi:peptidoglycan hydrolase-like protein with peptidoglycan-binding domain